MKKRRKYSRERKLVKKKKKVRCEMKILVIIFLVVTIFSMPLDKWTGLSDTQKATAVQMALDSFKAENPKCVTVKILFFADENFNLAIECIENGKEVKDENRLNGYSL